MKIEDHTRALRGAQILAQCLTLEDVDVLFGYPGGANLEIFDVPSEFIKHGQIIHIGRSELNKNKPATLPICADLRQAMQQSWPHGTICDCTPQSPDRWQRARPPWRRAASDVGDAALPGAPTSVLAE